MALHTALPLRANFACGASVATGSTVGAVGLKVGALGPAYFLTGGARQLALSLLACFARFAKFPTASTVQRVGLGVDAGAPAILGPGFTGGVADTSVANFFVFASVAAAAAVRVAVLCIHARAVTVGESWLAVFLTLSAGADTAFASLTAFATVVFGALQIDTRAAAILSTGRAI